MVVRGQVVASAAFKAKLVIRRVSLSAIGNLDVTLALSLRSFALSQFPISTSRAKFVAAVIVAEEAAT